MAKNPTNNGSMTLFEKIIAREIPSYTIAENEYCFAFLDIFPATAGHTLVIPKLATDKIFDLPVETLQQLMAFAKPIANAIEKAFPCDRVNMVTLGFEVPHAHIHLIPMHGMEDAAWVQQKQKATPESLLQAQQAILRYL